MQCLSRTSRRSFLAGSAGGWLHNTANQKKARIAITLDLEMARHFPTWEQTNWDYEKGNLNDETKEYAVAAARRVKRHGGRIHFFVVGRVFEQESMGWLQEILREGHPVGNHTYNHVNLTASEPTKLQYLFTRAPWLVCGRTVEQVVMDEISMTTVAMKTRLGVKPAGFRAPYGFDDGLLAYPAVQRLVLSQGFTWVSSKYVSHPTGNPGEEPSSDLYQTILRLQDRSQPFVYPSGLVEVPMCPISDVNAFRGGHWKLEYFLKATRLAVERAIARRTAFVFLAHPAILYVKDPRFEVVELMCALVGDAGPSATLADLGTIASLATAR